MRRRQLLTAAAAGLLAPLRTAAGEVVRRVGSVTFRVDLSQARPGGVAVVRLGARGRLGAAWALLEGRRAPFYSDQGVPRALVPIDLSAGSGPATLGVELAARRGEQRIAIPVSIAERPDSTRAAFLDERRRALLELPQVAHDARRLLAQLRTASDKPAPGPLRPPVAGAGQGFGEHRVYAGIGGVEGRIDGLGGERHRGIDYRVPVGTPVRAPGAGVVLFAGALTLAGETVVLDHGQGVVSVLSHLARSSVRAGDALVPGDALGLSGETGFTPEPLVEWRVYLHAVAVDPLVLGTIL